MNSWQVAYADAHENHLINEIAGLDSIVLPEQVSDAVMPPTLSQCRPTLLGAAPAVRARAEIADHELRAGYPLI